MAKTIILFCILSFSMANGCNSQVTQSNMEKDKNTNPLLCNPEKGFCEMPETKSGHDTNIVTEQSKPVKIIYFTDPICSSCWGIEPQLRKLKLEYGNLVEIEYHMGGLLPDWSYNSGGISKPSDVAHHWDEVSGYYDMPIDGDVWLEDPLNSSYPPSIAFKAAQLQDETKAVEFMRRIREMVFLEKKNITKWEYLQTAADEVGLDSVQLRKDYEGRANELFQADLELARKMGVRGFPTMIFSDKQNNQQTVYGSKPYIDFENAILSLQPEAVKHIYPRAWTDLFKKFPTMTTREFSELSGLTRDKSEILLQKLFEESMLTKTSTKNGVLWKERE